MQILYTLGIGLKHALDYLHFKNNTEEDFKNWIQQNLVTNKELIVNKEPVLSKDDILFFEANGYVIVKNTLTQKECEETCQVIYEFLGMNQYDIDSMYKPYDYYEGFMVNFTNHPTLEKNRNNPIVKAAFEQLYNTHLIYKSIDKVSINLPETEHYKFKGSSLHWDVSLELPIAPIFQGLFYLSDVETNGGAFCCVPGFHHEIETWLQKVPSNCDPRIYAVHNLKPKEILAKAGDFIIWHQALPHCASPNRSTTPRLVQYLTYFPTTQNNFPSKWI